MLNFVIFDKYFDITLIQYKTGTQLGYYERLIGTPKHSTPNPSN